MTFCIHVSVLLLILQLQSFRCDDKYCPKAVESAKTVTFCPTSKEEWDIAATKKNCSKIAALQNCTDANTFLYHCVINGFKNETLEVCAPPKLILGQCTEFNVAGDVIQGHRTAPCNKTFPKCDAYYNSTHAYKWFSGIDVFALTTKLYVLREKKKQNEDIIRKLKTETTELKDRLTSVY